MIVSLIYGDNDIDDGDDGDDDGASSGASCVPKGRFFFHRAQRGAGISFQSCKWMH